MRVLEFFYDLISPYSYLASTQVDALAVRTRAEVQWKPFYLPGVFKATGNHSPVETMAKAVHMLKDLNDWARHYGLPPIELPEEFPFVATTADRLALVAAEHGQLRDWSKRIYRLIWAERGNCNDEVKLKSILTELGLDANAAWDRAKSDEIKNRLRANTDDAIARGAYGAPTFFVDGEMFVGNDRLPFVEAALTR